MRVLHVIPAVAERYGGPSAAVLAMSRALRKRGVECLIATTDASPGGRLQVPLGEPTSFAGESVIFHRKIASEAFKVSWGLSRWLRSSVSVFDVIHIHAVFSHACIAAGRACRVAGRPYVVRPLGTLDPWSLQQKALRKRLFWALTGRRLLSGAAAVQYTSGRERVRTEGRLGLKNGVVIPLAVRVEDGLGTWQRGSEVRPPVLLFMSRIHPKKNVPLLLFALDRMSKARPDLAWRLHIAGDGEPGHVAEVRALVTRLGLEARVQFLGWLGDQEKRNAFATSDVMVLPSAQENFGIAVAEAMVAGLPAVVSTGVDLSDDVSRESAGWVCEAQLDSLAASLIEALDKPEERTRRGLNARRLGMTFSNERMVDRLVALYETVLRSDGVMGSPRP